MSRRFFASMGVVSGLIALVSLAQVPVQGQAQPAKPTKWTPPVTPDGQPDLQGVWSYATLTPLQRPIKLVGKDVLTEAEATELERQAAAKRREADAPLPAGQVGAYNQFWMDQGKVVGDKRAFLIVDPADGRIPPLTPDAQKRADAHRDTLARLATGPEDRDASERCIMGYNAGPPMVPVGYNQNVQVFQTRDYVVLHNEMIHNSRIIPLDGRQHLSQHLRPWSGDSRGHWEGRTLVVQTTNFTDRIWNQFNGWNMASDENLQVVERFTRVDAQTLQYEFTVDDPTTWTRPWTARIPMSRSEGIYEYACHEGNYGLPGILRGARAEEKATEEAATRRTSAK